MKFEELNARSRTVRRFDQQHAVKREILEYLVACARLAPSASNRQPLRFMLVSDHERCKAVTGMVGWAGYLRDWDGPQEGERPTAYIIILCDTRVVSEAAVDAAIAARTMLLAATEAGLGGCMFGAVKKGKLHAYLGADRHLEIAMVVAIGKPVEQVVLEEVGLDASIRYYRDEQGIHHVPKIALEELIVEPGNIDQNRTTD